METVFSEDVNRNGADGDSVNADILPAGPTSTPEALVQEEKPQNVLGEKDLSSELNRVFIAIETLSKEFQILQQGFDSKIKYDTTKENIIDTLHRELQTYREGMHFHILRPIFNDLISMYDDLSSLLKHNKPTEGENETVGKLRQSLASFQETLESTLENHGVTVITIADDTFIPQKQRVLRTEYTSDPQKDRMICERVRKGFEYEGRVLRPESVVLYKFVENATPTQK
jgi:molecular chaperone GrpE